MGAGDAIEIVFRPEHGVTIGLFAEARLGDRDRLEELLVAEQLSAVWRSEIEDQVAKRAA